MTGSCPPLATPEARSGSRSLQLKFKKATEFTRMHQTKLLILQPFILEVAAEIVVKPVAMDEVQTGMPVESAHRRSRREQPLRESDADNGAVAAGWG